MSDQEAPRWLNKDESAAWEGLARTFTLLPAALDAQLRRDSDVTHFEYQIMVSLSRSTDQTLAMSDIASRLRSSLSKLSHAVSRLETEGLITRVTHPSNRRITLATLTESGQNKLAATAPGHVGMVRQLVFDSLTTAQVRQLEAIARRITDAIDQESP